MLHNGEAGGESPAWTWSKVLGFRKILRNEYSTILHVNVDVSGGVQLMLETAVGLGKSGKHKRLPEKSPWSWNSEDAIVDGHNVLDGTLSAVGFRNKSIWWARELFSALALSFSVMTSFFSRLCFETLVLFLDPQAGNSPYKRWINVVTWSKSSYLGLISSNCKMLFLGIQFHFRAL